MEVLALLTLLTIAGFGAGVVILVAQPLRLLPRCRAMSTGVLLAISHSVLVLLFLLAAPAYIVWQWGSPYGDVYGPYLLVPGSHIYYLATLIFNLTVFHWLLGFMNSFPASVLCLIVGPGLIALLIGGLQWFLIGICWDRWVAKLAELFFLE